MKYVVRHKTRHRWIKQRNGHSCVPVAFLNLMKWNGQRVSYKRDYTRLYKLTECSKDGAGDWTTCLSLIKNTICETIKFPTYEQIWEATRAGSAVLLRTGFFSQRQLCGHLMMVVAPEKGSGIFCVNTGDGHLQLNRRMFESWYLQRIERQGRIFPVARIIMK